jgi:hypothetical protein
MYTSPPTVVVRRAGDARRRLALAAAALMAVVACAAGVASYSTQATAAGPSVESMYHMWLGPNGLPLSPRKQRGLLFQFCTTVMTLLRRCLRVLLRPRALPALCGRHAPTCGRFDTLEVRTGTDH